MAKRLLPPDWHVTKDDGNPATDATLAVRLAGTSTPTPIWYDKDLTLPTTAGTAAVNCDATGYPAAGGNDIAIWGADDVSYDIIVSATGYNGSQAKTLEDVAVADTTTTDESSSEIVFGSVFANGSLEACTGATSGSNLSGDGDGDETVDGWYLTQPAAASNAWSQQPGFAIGADPVEARFSVRVGRPNLSVSTNEIRWWAVAKPGEAYRLRGKSVTLRFSALAGANFSASGLNVRLATGTTESEDGDLIDSGGFGGHVNAIDQAQAISTTAVRFEYTVTLGATIKEIGLQFSYTPVGTAGAADYFQIQDIELKEETASEEFSFIPEAIEFFLSKLRAGGRLFISSLIADPGADRLIFWDDSASDFANLTLPNGLSISGTTMSFSTPIVNYLADPLSVSELASITGNFGSAAFKNTAASGDALANLSVANTWAARQDNTVLLDGDFVAFAARNTSSGASAFTYGLVLGNDTGSPRAGFVLNGSGAAGFAGAGTASIGTFVAVNFGLLRNSAMVAQVAAGGIQDASASPYLIAGKTMVPLPAAAWRAQNTNGPASYLAELSSNKQMIEGFAFDASTDEFIQICFPAPKGWNESTVTARFRWYAPSGTGSVVFGMQGFCASDDDPLDASWGSAQTVTDALTATGDLMITAETSAITLAGTPAEGDLIWLRVYRDADNGSDTFSADAILLAVDLFMNFNAANDV